jgi:putative ABC transport system permease protein
MKERKPITPPRLAVRLFELYCQRAAIEDLHGDMEELFYHNLTRMPVRQAKFKYWRQVISLLFSYAIKKRKNDSAYHPYHHSTANMTMIAHYFKTGFRNLAKNKGFSLINILGLSLGIASCVLLLFFIEEETSYDKHFPGADRLYRITSTMHATNGNVNRLNRTSPIIGPSIATELPEIEAATRVVKDLSVEEEIVKYNDQSFYEKRGYQVDSTFFQMFPYEFIEGNPATALHSPSAIVLSETLAKKIFGNKTALDESLTVPTYRGDTLRVTGVIKSGPNPSHLDADFYMSGLEKAMQYSTTWATDNFVFTYVKLKEGTSAEEVTAKLADLMNRHGEQENREMGRKKVLGLQHIQDVHLHSRHFSDAIELGTRSSATYIYLTAAIALLVLLLACINFINLSTAKGSQRAKEIGIRKTMGAHRTHLLPQFLGESIGLALVAMLFSLLLIYFALPYFNEMVQKNFTLGSQNILFVGGALLTLALVTGLIAGTYPALVLSSFDPVRVLKDKHPQSGSFNLARKGLIVFQFSTTIILISSILIIHRQLDYLQSKPLGFDASYKVMVPLRTSEATANYHRLKNTFKGITGVTQVTASSNLPSTPATADWSFYPTGKETEAKTGHFIISVDEDYFRVMGIPLIGGRDFSFPSDAAPNIPSPDRVKKVMVNRSSLQQMHIDLANAPGVQLTSSMDNNRFEIVGVVEDFHQYSLHQSISPLIFYLSSDSSIFKYVMLSIDPQHYSTAMTQINEAWRTLIPDTPFESQLLTESLQRQYESDDRVSKIISSATVLAVLISCLGLYGLSIFVAQRKTKEIGIRKVLGASIPNILAVVSKEFVQVILVSIAVSIPISYLVMGEWLKTFAYHITPGWLLFFVSGLAGIFITLLSIAYEAGKASLVNPVDTLRAE